MRVPSELYTPSLRPYRGLTDLAYPFHEGTAVVTHCSRLCFDRRKVNLSQVFAGQQVGVRQGESVTHVLGIIRYPCDQNGPLQTCWPPSEAGTDGWQWIGSTAATERPSPAPVSRR